MPVDPEKVDEFDPEGVPNAGELLRELDEAGKMEVDGEGAEHHDGKLLNLYVDRT